MELNKLRQIRLTKEYLPGFQSGFSVGPVGQIDPSIITQQDPYSTNPQDIPITLTDIKPKTVAESTFKDLAGNIFSSGLGFVGAVGNSFGSVKGQGELMADAGTSFGNVSGFGYTKLNDINYNSEMSELSKENTNNTLNTAAIGASFGASIGSIVPGIGTALGAVIGGVGGLVTGLFGSSSRKRRLERKIIDALQKVNALNTYNRSSAHSDYLASLYNMKHQNTQDDLLYGAKCGKDMFTLLPGYTEGFDIYSAFGNGPGKANSRVAYGETIYDPIEGKANIVDKGRLNQDTNLSYLRPQDVVFGNHIDWRTGKTFRDEALPFAAVLERLSK